MSTGSKQPRAGLPLAVLEFLARAGARLDVPAGTVIFRRGEPADSTLLIESGSVEVHLADGVPPKHMEAGALIGELALLAPDGCRTATVVAGPECRVTVIGRAQFERLLEERPDLGCRALRHACAYLIASEGQLVQSLERRNAELERTLDYLRRTREELDATEIQAQTDALTGLYNRRCFDHQLPRFIEREQSEPHGLALLLIDLDRFKPVNDAHGHAAGDAVLRAVAAVLGCQLRTTDLACRLGGDEFAVVLWPAGAASECDPLRVATELRDSIASAAVRLDETVVTVGATVGGATWSGGDSSATLLARADRHLYAGKDAGRNVVCFDGRIA